jgi:hypothetical protein
MGPRYEHLFRNAALTVMADPAGGTFIDIPKLFRDPQYVKQKLQYVKDLNVLEFWQKEMPQSQRSNEFGEVVSWFVSKFGAFLSNEMMRNIIGQVDSAFDLRDIMDNKKILLVNLSKGRTGDLNSKLLGMIFVMKFQAAAMSRANIPESQRVDFSLYVDEFQNFSTDSFATIMSEARKYHLNLIVANQFTTQLTEEIRDAVFGNMGTIVAFRIGQNDVESLSRYFQPTFDGDDLLRVPNHNTIVRTLIGGVPTQPFSMATLPPLGEANPKLSVALKQLTAAKFGRPKNIVEKEIFERIATKESPVPGGGLSAGGGAGAGRPLGGSPWQQGGAAAPAGAMAGGARPAPAASPWQQAPAPSPRTGTGSFLDEWLTKRSSAPAAVAPSGQFGAAPLGSGTPSYPVSPPPPVASVPSSPLAPTAVPVRPDLPVANTNPAIVTQAQQSPIPVAPALATPGPDSAIEPIRAMVPVAEEPIRPPEDVLDVESSGDSFAIPKTPEEENAAQEAAAKRRAKRKRRRHKAKHQADQPNPATENPAPLAAKLPVVVAEVLPPQETPQTDMAELQQARAEHQQHEVEHPPEDDVTHSHAQVRSRHILRPEDAIMTHQEEAVQSAAQHETEPDSATADDEDLDQGGSSHHEANHGLHPVHEKTIRPLEHPQPDLPDLTASGILDKPADVVAPVPSTVPVPENRSDVSVPPVADTPNSTDGSSQAAESNSGVVTPVKSELVTTPESVGFAIANTDAKKHAEPDVSPRRDAVDQAKVIELPKHDGLATVISPQADESKLPPLRPRSALENELSHGDTIYIDQEGNLQVVEEAAKGSEPAATATKAVATRGGDNAGNT